MENLPKIKSGEYEESVFLFSPLKSIEKLLEEEDHENNMAVRWQIPAMISSPRLATANLIKNGRVPITSAKFVTTLCNETES
jgi:hypothetical protein